MHKKDSAHQALSTQIGLNDFLDSFKLGSCVILPWTTLLFSYFTSKTLQKARREREHIGKAGSTKMFKSR